MDAMMKMPKHFRIVFHVHDEIVVECEKDQGTLEEVRSIMCEIPDWAEGCPVNAEGFEAERYRK
jgi:DNA polymerase